jgi:hypothetical protein
MDVVESALTSRDHDQTTSKILSLQSQLLGTLEDAHRADKSSLLLFLPVSKQFLGKRAGVGLFGAS